MKELYFICRRCAHHLFVEEKKGWVKKVVMTDCPNCGEEPDENWVFVGYGSFKKMFPDLS